MKFICFKCGKRDCNFIGSAPYRGSRMCATCNGKDESVQSDKPSGDFSPWRKSNEFRLLPLSHTITEATERRHVRQPKIPGMGSCLEPDLCAKVRGDCELRGMSIRQAAQANGISYSKAYYITRYISSRHIKPA